jgi:ABC-type glycerol-3-phosphate transport system permease component
MIVSFRFSNFHCNRFFIPLPLKYAAQNRAKNLWGSSQTVHNFGVLKSSVRCFVDFRKSVFDLVSVAFCRGFFRSFRHSAFLAVFALYLPILGGFPLPWAFYRRLICRRLKSAFVRSAVVLPALFAVFRSPAFVVLPQISGG